MAEKNEKKRKAHVRKGDTVYVRSGKDLGKTGKVLGVVPGQRVKVEGINVQKRHTKPTRALPQGGVIAQAGPLHLSKVMLVCPTCGKPTRVGHVRLEDGSIGRLCRRCERPID